MSRALRGWRVRFPSASACTQPCNGRRPRRPQWGDTVADPEWRPPTAQAGYEQPPTAHPRSGTTPRTMAAFGHGHRSPARRNQKPHPRLRSAASCGPATLQVAGRVKSLPVSRYRTTIRKRHARWAVDRGRRAYWRLHARWRRPAPVTECEPVLGPATRGSSDIRVIITAYQTEKSAMITRISGVIRPGGLW